MKTMAQYSVALLFLVSLGCTTLSKSAPARVEWRAPGSNLEQNVAAAAALCPIGTTAAAARRILGTDGRLVHYYGPTVKGSGVRGDIAVRNVPDRDDWGLQYEVPGGRVVLFFKARPKHSDLEEAIVARIEGIKTVKRFPLPGAATGKP